VAVSRNRERFSVLVGRSSSRKRNERNLFPTVYVLHPTANGEFAQIEQSRRKSFSYDLLLLRLRLAKTSIVDRPLDGSFATHIDENHQSRPILMYSTKVFQYCMLTVFLQILMICWKYTFHC